jgi:DNA-binding PadR family transcriptional regulator
MSLRHGILGLLNYGPKSGYDIIKVFNDSLTHFWTAQPSQVYRELDALAASDLVRASGQVQRGHLVKTMHEITDSGRTELLRWLSESPYERRGTVRNAFLLKLFFQASLGRDALQELLLAAKAHAEAEAAKLRSAAREVMEGYAARATPLEAFCWKATLEYGLAACEMESHWAAERLAELGTIPVGKPGEGVVT